MSSVLDVIKRKSGVIVGDDVRAVFDHAHAHGYAIPAVNVTSSSIVNGVLEAARDNKAPIILQVSSGGSAYFAGKGISNDGDKASIAGSIAAAHFIRSIAPAYGIPVILHSDHCARKILPWLDGMLDADEAYYKEHGEPLFSSHMIDLSAETDDFNIATTKKYFERASKMNQWLEMEIGITGGEEDGVDNSHATNLYTTSETVYSVYEALKPISPNFSIAAAFGNVHGVYKPGNVQLRPDILGGHQEYAKKQSGSKSDKPIYLVFHGGSGSSADDFRTGIKNGVVKVNVDTDTQYAYLEGIRDYVLSKKDYLLKPVGNPEGEDKPNKKYFDPRVWVREGEKTLIRKVTENLKIFQAVNKV